MFASGACSPHFIVVFLCGCYNGASVDLFMHLVWVSCYLCARVYNKAEPMGQFLQGVPAHLAHTLGTPMLESIRICICCWLGFSFYNLCGGLLK